MQNYWKQFVLACNVFRYKELTKKTTTEAFSFFFKSLGLCLCITLLFAVPLFLLSAGKVSAEFEKPSEFTVNITLHTENPVLIPPNNPFFALGNESTGGIRHAAPIAFAGDDVYISIIPSIPLRADISALSNMRENASTSGMVVFIMLLFILPSIVFYLSLYFIIKYLLIALILSCITFVIYTILRKKMAYKKIFVATVYSLLAYMLIELLLLPFGIPAMIGISFAWIVFIAYLIWYAIICIEIVEDF
ncbi:MAG: hypothetical protein ACMXYE_04650 [Candidatus Woesearchaeota archaeon]